MDRDQVLSWAKKYDEDQSARDSMIERWFGSSKYQQLSKPKLKRMLTWKFKGALPSGGRLKHFMPFVERTKDSEIEQAFREAIGFNDELARIKRLDKLPAIGPAMTSVILTFHDPKNYGVIDLHAWRELFGTKEPSSFTPEHLVRFLSELRKIAKKHRMRARDVEKALFQRNYEE